jgi:hypothetical protein
VVNIDEGNNEGVCVMMCWIKKIVTTITREMADASDRMAKL